MWWWASHAVFKASHLKSLPADSPLLSWLVPHFLMTPTCQRAVFISRRLTSSKNMPEIISIWEVIAAAQPNLIKTQIPGGKLCREHNMTPERTGKFTVWLSYCLKACALVFFFFFKLTVLCLVAQFCPTFVTLWTVACQAPLSLGILQATILEWVAMTSSRGPSQPRDWTQVSCNAGRFFASWATREALSLHYLEFIKSQEMG